MQLQFLGAVGTVTGSKYLLETGDKGILIDCGLFQGFKQLRLRNWSPPPVDPKALDAVVLTHAHLDHSGYLPLLVRRGFAGPIYATAATRDLCAILLPDSGHLHERDADFANRYGFSKHKPALPLYTEAEAEASLRSFRPAIFDEPFDLGDGLRATFHTAGHILGAASIALEWNGRTLLFSGDLGRPESAVLPLPPHRYRADYLVVESTYGDALHEKRDPEDALAEIIRNTAKRNGVVLIPSFAVGRTQVLLYHIHRLKMTQRIPDLPVFVDSPMAIKASRVFFEHVGMHKLSAEESRAIEEMANYVGDVEGSKALDQNGRSKILISASGMATGGRVLHHLKVFLPDRRNTVLFAGFQAGGTRGASLVSGAQSVKIHGEYVPVRAEVDQLNMLSAHADSDEIMGWLRQFEAPPRRTFVTHGEPAASDALRHRIEEELGWSACVPDYLDKVTLE